MKKELIQIFRKPSQNDYFNFLIRCYFGEGNDLLRMSVERAYLDLNRTLHGFATHRTADRIRENAHALVIQNIYCLKNIKLSQKSYDNWHAKACDDLRTSFWKGGFRKFTYGQAQKWLNMSMKYIFVMGKDRLPGYQNCYPFAHIPIDNIFMDAIRPYRKIRLPCAWSRIDDYEVYLKLQKEFRELFSNSIPLDVEFKLWIA